MRTADGRQVADPPKHSGWCLKGWGSKPVHQKAQTQAATEVQQRLSWGKGLKSRGAGEDSEKKKSYLSFPFHALHRGALTPLRSQENQTQRHQAQKRQKGQAINRDSVHRPLLSSCSIRITDGVPTTPFLTPLREHWQPLPPPSDRQLAE